jgi:hypothetical protein
MFNINNSKRFQSFINFGLKGIKCKHLIETANAAKKEVIGN